MPCTAGPTTADMSTALIFSPPPSLRGLFHSHPLLSTMIPWGSFVSVSSCNASLSCEQGGYTDNGTMLEPHLKIYFDWQRYGGVKPVALAWCTRIRALCARPDRSTFLGERDRSLKSYILGDQFDDAPHYTARMADDLSARFPGSDIRNPLASRQAVASYAWYSS
jgi:hypothetical protein